jgi:pyruvate kinase
VPVVWATQVLETLAKSGRPTRAKVTDAAMSVRAECVMLNKGPYIAQAVTLLDDILRRMSAHQEKKSARFRALEVARAFETRVDGDSPRAEMLRDERDANV